MCMGPPAPGPRQAGWAAEGVCVCVCESVCVACACGRVCVGVCVYGACSLCGVRVTYVHGAAGVDALQACLDLTAERAVWNQPHAPQIVARLAR